MEGSIGFPHLGIELRHVIKSVSVGGFEIACYGMVLAAAMVTGILLVMKLADCTGQKGDDYFDLGILAVLVSVLCARIYYVAFSWDYYSRHIPEIFNLREGGLAIYGGVAGGVVTVLIFCRVRKMKYLQVLDTAAVGLVWGQMIGRWGNFFNREAFGDYTDGLLAMRLPLTDVRASEVTDAMLEHLQVIGDVQYIQVHPTFLYESLWNFGVLLVLLFLTLRKKKSYQGQVLLMYFFLYGAGRFWIEGLRTDQLLFPGTQVPVSWAVSGILMLVSGLLLLYRRIKRKETKEYESKRTSEGTD